MIRYVAVIDIGKTNAKIALVDTTTAEEIQIIKRPASVNTETVYPSLDHIAITAFIGESLSTLSQQYTIDAITVTTHGATVALIDADGQLALPVLDYEFQGVDDTRHNYKQHRPPFAETGSPALPGGLNIGAQLYWQQMHYPDHFANVVTVLTWPQYWVHLLTNNRHNDVSSLGCHSDLYEPHAQRYSTLVKHMGWASLMPPTKLSGQLSGTLTPHMAQLTNLSPTTPVFTGIHDSNASLVPHLITRQTPLTVVSTGTWFIVMAMGGSPVALDETRDTLLNVNAYGQAVPSARFMGGRERELLNVTKPACEQAMTRLLERQPDPVMLLPSVVAGCGPYPNAITHWIGSSIDDDNTVRPCAVALYLALMTHECMQLVGSRGPTYIEGPLAHDPHYAQMLAAVSKRPVMISGSQTGTSVGAAMLINAPVNPPIYKTVDLDQDRSAQLTRYAVRWQQALRDHAI